jgi:serine/threonine protein phosphatase PrpC
VIVRGASIPGGDLPGQDRWIATSRGVIVLDGASAFDPAAPAADHYVDALLATLAETFDSPTDLPTILSVAIARVRWQLNAEPGGGPSSTVLLLREVGEWLELLVLGDSTAVVGRRGGLTERWTDQRIADVAVDLRDQYRHELRAGRGYGSAHRERLREIQRAERAVRNTAGGYWIAEADHGAAQHAIVRRYPRPDVNWCVLATDGAQRGLDHRRTDWADLPKASAAELRSHLDDLQSWEADADPDGSQLPRAKRHDDKTVVTWTNDQ